MLARGLGAKSAVTYANVDLVLLVWVHCGGIAGCGGAVVCVWPMVWTGDGAVFEWFPVAAKGGGQTRYLVESSDASLGRAGWAGTVNGYETGTRW